MANNRENEDGPGIVYGLSDELLASYIYENQKVHKTCCHED